MPAYELREHLPTHGYAVLGKFPSPDAARDKRDALIAEDRQRQGRYTIDYVQQAEPDPVAAPAAPNSFGGVPFDVIEEPSQQAQEETDMGLMRTSGHRPNLPKNSAADMVEPEGDKPVRGASTAGTAKDAVENLEGKEPKVSSAAKAAGAKKP